MHCDCLMYPHSASPKTSLHLPDGSCIGVVYVASPDLHGNNANDGCTATSPVATLARAQQLARTCFVVICAQRHTLLLILSVLCPFHRVRHAVFTVGNEPCVRDCFVVDSHGIMPLLLA